MQLLAAIVPPPELVRSALEAAHELCAPAPAAGGEPRGGLLDRIRGRRRAAIPATPVVALRPVAPDAVFVRLATFGNVTAGDADSLAHALRSARLDGEVDALRDLYVGVNEVARQQRFFLDRRSFRSALHLGSVGAADGALVPPGTAGLEVALDGPSWTPSHLTLVRASFGAAGATYAELVQVELAPGAEEPGTGTGD